MIKGLELHLPEDCYFLDKGNNIRKKIRVKWWLDGAKTYRDYAQVSKKQLESIPDTKLPNDFCDPKYSSKNKPVFIGHYWMTGTPPNFKK